MSSIIAPAHYFQSIAWTHIGKKGKTRFYLKKHSSKRFENYANHNLIDPKILINSKCNIKNTTPTCIATEFLKTSDKDLESRTRKKECYFYRTNITCLLTGNNASEKRVQLKKNLQSTETKKPTYNFISRKKYMSKMKVESFLDIQKLREFITSRPALQENLKRSLPVRKEMISHGNMCLYKKNRNHRKWYLCG